MKHVLKELKIGIWLHLIGEEMKKEKCGEN